MTSADWTDTENDTIVASYFAMLSDELSGRSYNKAANNRQLQAQTGRSRGSIEFKLCNVSGAFRGFGLPIVKGYQPRFNFQSSLTEAVSRWLHQNPDWEIALHNSATHQLSEARPLFIAPAPTHSNLPPPDELEQMERIARRFDVAARDERNRALGKAGEERALHHERITLKLAGRDDLARKVRWVSQEDGDGAGYDIASFTPEGKDRLIEVKTTNVWIRTPFYISRNEIDVANERRDDWYLLRLHDFARDPRAFELRPPLDAHVTLTATNYQARFQ